MDLGIAGRTAIVCASSGGLGRACAEALVAEGVDVVINGRGRERLEAAAAHLRSLGCGKVTPVLGDATAAQGQAALLAACPKPDILINNAAGPAPLYFMDTNADDWVDAVQGNMLAPLNFVRTVLPGMRARRFGRIINVTSAMVTTPRPHMSMSAGARAGLTAAMKAIALDVAKDNVTINNLLPERFDTDRQHYMAQETSKRENITYEEARARQVHSIAARRLGDPKEFGATCAFLCSALAGFISGQNVHLDGGSYPGLV
jgi:3-oxoacyl-[acyl-carrier protein] reductase